MLKVGLTGNIGSGKSTVSKIFQSLGVPVFIADEEAKKLYADAEVQKEVVELFGNDIFDIDGILQREKLANIIFNDDKALRQINQIIHPRTLQKYMSWLIEHTESVYTIHESAILFENKLEGHFDKIINVSAPAELRIKRVMKRDTVDFKLVSERINNQLSDEKKNKMADFVVINDGNKFIIPQLMKIHSVLSKIQ